MYLVVIIMLKRNRQNRATDIHFMQSWNIGAPHRPKGILVK